MSKKFVPTDKQRAMVRMMAIAGVTQEMMAKCVKNEETGKPISKQTLANEFREEIDIGLSSMLAMAVGVLFQRMKDNDLGAACFVLKTRGGWHEHPDPVTFDEEKLARRLHELTQVAQQQV